MKKLLILALILTSTSSSFAREINDITQRRAIVDGLISLYKQQENFVIIKNSNGAINNCQIFSAGSDYLTLRAGNTVVNVGPISNEATKLEITEESQPILKISTLYSNASGDPVSNTEFLISTDSSRKIITSIEATDSIYGKVNIGDITKPEYKFLPTKVKTGVKCVLR